MQIAEIETTPLQMRFIPDVGPHMDRAVTHVAAQTLTRVRLQCGAMGWGDAIGPPRDADEWVGRSAVVALRGCRDSALQMACYDAVGRALGVPAHQLMGRQRRPRVPFAYWTIDLPPKTLQRQILHAASLGHTTYKFKCRPWWDVREQMAAAAEVAPPGFKLWLDFNGHLREARLALPILRDLAEFECVGGFESPIPQCDVEGYQTLRRRVDRPIAVHYGGGACHVRSRPFDRGAPAHVQLEAGVADGYVLGGGDVDGVQARDAVLSEYRRPFWIQAVGTGLRAAWVAHLASTCEQALLSCLAANDLWAQDVATAPALVDGWRVVPEGPGLGVEVDEAAVRALAEAPPTREVRRLSTVVYPSGVRWHFSTEQRRHKAFYFGDLPGFTPGIRLEVRDDDGSAEFADLFGRCEQAPVVE